MTVSIDFASDAPIYKQLKTEIIQAILAGRLREGDSLPPIRRLAGDLGINLHTVGKVYGLLSDEGYVRMDRRNGAVVCAPRVIDDGGLKRAEEALRPIVIELRARSIRREQFDKIIDELWRDD